MGEALTDATNAAHGYQAPVLRMRLSKELAALGSIDTRLGVYSMGTLRKALGFNPPSIRAWACIRCGRLALLLTPSEQNGHSFRKWV